MSDKKLTIVENRKGVSTNIEVNIQSNEAFYIIQGLISIYTSI